MNELTRFAGNGAHYRFADFQADFRAFELRKHGLKIKLQEQPLRILHALLERPGELVTREELQQRLWPRDLYVDFERNLTSAMNKLRAALSDSAENPRYIETLPRRGHRFIAAVEEIAPAKTPVVGADPPGLPLPLDRALGLSATPSEASALPRPGDGAPGPRRVALAFAIPAILVVGTVLLATRIHRNSSGEPAKVAAVPRRIVVLPFSNLTGDPQQEYLCDGLTEEMIAELSRVAPGHLDVIARTSAMQYKNTRKSLDQIGRELKVSYVLESSVREFGGRVRVTAQLVRASDAGHLWSGEYDREMKDVLQLQQEIAAAVAGEIKLSLNPGTSARWQNAPSVVPEAFHEYLMGRYLWNKRTPRDIVRSVDHYHEALRLDPSFALAYAALADSLLMDDDPMTVAEAKDAARKAIDLDPTLGEPHASLGFIALMHDWDFHLSKQEFQRALELSPNYATAHHWYAFYLADSGRLPEAIRELNRALEIDPFSPAIRGALADGLSQSGQNDEALAEGQKMLEFDPGFAKGRLTLAEIYERKGMFREAFAEIKKVQETGLIPGAAIDLARVQARAGERAEAEKTIRDLERGAGPASARPSLGDLAIINLALGNREQAMACLEKAYDQHDATLLDIKFRRDFDPLRSDPRFQALVRTMNFPAD